MGDASADRRCGDQRRSRPDADRREAAVGEHARRDARHRGGAREPQTRTPGHRDRRQDLPPRDVHRNGDAQPDDLAPRRRAAGDSDPRRISLRMARRADQRDRDSAFARGRRPGAVCDGRVDQHDGARGIHCRARIGRRRCDHRCRERRAAITPGTSGRIPAFHATVDRAHHPRRVARSAAIDLARDADHRPRGDAGVLHGRIVGRILRAARAVVPAGDAGVDDRRADGDAGDVPDPARSDRSAVARIAARAVAEAPLRVGALAHHRSSARDVHRRRGHRRCRAGGPAFLWPRSAAVVQRARFPDALRACRRDVARRNLPHHAARQPGIARDSRCRKFRRPHRPCDQRRRAVRHQLH